MTQVNNQTKKEVCVLIRIKPKYTEEFCIMMIACKELCNRISKFKKLAKIDEAFSVLGPFDFLLELSEKKYLFSWNEQSQDEKKLKEFLKEDFDASWVKKLKSEWKDNIIVFADGKKRITLIKQHDKVILYINCERTCELVKKDGKYGGIDIYRKEEEVNERINRTIFKIRETLGSYIYDTHTLTKFKTSYLFKNKIDANKITKHVHVLIKINPNYTEQFLKKLEKICSYPASKGFVIIRLCSILGPFDFVLELIAEGAEGEEEEMTKNINRKIFEIRKTLGKYIYETHTIEKFKIPMTKEDLESFFKKKLGEEYLVRLPDRDGEKVPHERHKPHDKVDLKDIRDAETTALKKLLENAKTFLEAENLDERLIDLNSRVEELEKRQDL